MTRRDSPRSGAPRGKSPQGRGKSRGQGESRGHGESRGYGKSRDDRGKSFGKSTGKPAGKSFGKPTGKSFGKPAGKSFGKPAGKSFGKPAGKSFGKGPAGKSFERPLSQSAMAKSFAKGPTDKRRGSDEHPFERRPAFRQPSKAPVAQVERRVFPEVQPGPPGPLRIGDYLLTTRPGSEIDLIEELGFKTKPIASRIVAPGLVAAAAKKVPELAFARQGFPVSALVPADPHALSSTISSYMGTSRWAFDLWVADSDDSNRTSAAAAQLKERTLFEIDRRDRGKNRVANAREALQENGVYIQACLLEGDRCAVGVTPAHNAVSLAPGGRLRVHVGNEAPSRAAMKLVEAFAWLNREPEPNDLCVDLGAAPGGWAWVLLKKRARVVAIDPGNLDKSIIKEKGLTHIRGDAFRFEAPEQPEETVDWLFCDMAFRPLEVASLLAKWARRRWARLLVANIKLPMRKKAEMLARVLEILENGGWNNLRARQLYHDRDEVTIAGVRV